MTKLNNPTRLSRLKESVKPLILSASITAMLLIPVSAAAKGTLTGTVVNKQTGEPMDFASVQLIDKTTKKLLTIGTSTDDKGQFTLADVPDGDYIIKVSSLGSVDVERAVKVADKDINVGTLKMAEDSKMLQEVVVEGVKSQMRFELDKKVFQVDANIAAAGQSASELLESIPSVEVDQDGEVSLRGDTSVTIWINGKESGLSSDNRASILEQIPAETIDRIEVITNPSSKYSAEGSEGIINIILKKNRKAGYYGSAEVGGNSFGGANAGVNINVNSGKWDSYASLSYRHGAWRGGSESERRYYGENGDESGFLDSESKSRNYSNNFFLRAGTTYNMTDKDAFSISAYGMFGHHWGYSNTNYKSNLPGQWFSNRNHSDNKGNMIGAHADLGYKHEWSDTHSLDITVGYNHWGGPSTNTYLQEQKYDTDSDGNPLVDANGDPAILEDSDYQWQHQNIGVNSIEAKVDYTVKFNNWLKLDAGYNGNYNLEDTPVETKLGTTSDNAKPNYSLYNDFVYHNNISALYASLGGKYKAFSFSAGLRSEAWQVRAWSLTNTDGIWQRRSDVEPAKINKIALFPSAFVSWALPKDNELQLNYTRRIRRPWGGQLNSFINISDPTSITYGNPELQPQYTNSFELNYIKTWTDHMISLSAYFRDNEHVISRISYRLGDVMYTTNANVNSRLNTGAELVVKNTFLNGKLQFTTTGNAYYNSMDAWALDFAIPQYVLEQMPAGSVRNVAVSGTGRHSFSWDVREMVNARLPWGLSLQVSGNYRAARVSAQGTRGANWNVDAGLRKIAGNWSFSLNARDIFDSRKMDSTTTGAGYWQHQKRWRGGRQFSLTVKYSFGNMRSKKNRQGDMEPTDGSGYGGDDMMME